MNIEDKQPTRKGPVDWFTGDVWIDTFAPRKPEPSRMEAGRVRFAPGARTAWHSHAVGQTLHVTEGVALMGTRDGGVIEELLLYEPTLLDNVGQTNYALQNYTEFPETWELAEQRMRLDDLYMPGTNVPREEATKEIYESLRADLPRKQLF